MPLSRTLELTDENCPTCAGGVKRYVVDDTLWCTKCGERITNLCQDPHDPDEGSEQQELDRLTILNFDTEDEKK